MCLSPFLLVELPLETVVVSLLLLGAVDVTDVATLVLVPLLVVIIGVVGRLPETDKGSWQSSTYNEKINRYYLYVHLLLVCTPLRMFHLYRILVVPVFHPLQFIKHVCIIAVAGYNKCTTYNRSLVMQVLQSHFHSVTK